MGPDPLAADPHTSVLAIGCVALGEGLLPSGSQFPHVPKKNNNPRLSGGGCHRAAESSHHQHGPERGRKRAGPIPLGPDTVVSSPRTPMPARKTCLGAWEPLPALYPALPKVGPERMRVAKAI